MKTEVNKHARMAVMARLSGARRAATIAEQRAADLLKKKRAAKILRDAATLARTNQLAKKAAQRRRIEQDPRFITRCKRENLRRQAETIRLQQLRMQEAERLRKESRELAEKEAARREEDRARRAEITLHRLQAIKAALPLVAAGERAGHPDIDGSHPNQHRIQLEIVSLDLESGVARIIFDRVGEFISSTFDGKALDLGREADITANYLLDLLDQPEKFRLVPCSAQ